MSIRYEPVFTFELLKLLSSILIAFLCRVLRKKEDFVHLITVCRDFENNDSDEERLLNRFVVLL